VELKEWRKKSFVSCVAYVRSGTPTPLYRFAQVTFAVPKRLALPHGHLTASSPYIQAQIRTIPHSVLNGFLQ